MQKNKSTYKKELNTEELLAEIARLKKELKKKKKYGLVCEEKEEDLVVRNIRLLFMIIWRLMLLNNLHKELTVSSVFTFFLLEMICLMRSLKKWEGK